MTLNRSGGTSAAVVALGLNAGALAAPAAPIDALGLLQTPGPAPAAATESLPSTEPVRRFGEQWSWRLDVEGDWINDLSDANQAMARLGIAWFFVDDVELAGYVTGGYVWQPVEDAGAYGLDLELRWHFLARDTWSLFASIGGGVMGSTASVPDGGSEFNFTPSLGLGCTLEVARDIRLYVSARWLHISNAGTYADNPGRDNLSVWAGLSFGL